MTVDPVIITQQPNTEVVVLPAKTTNVYSYSATLITSATSYAINHNLGTLEVFATAFLIADGTTVPFTMVRNSASTATLTFAGALSANTVRVVIIG